MRSGWLGQRAAHALIAVGSLSACAGARGSSLKEGIAPVGAGPVAGTTGPVETGRFLVYGGAGGWAAVRIGRGTRGTPIALDAAEHVSWSPNGVWLGACDRDASRTRLLSLDGAPSRPLNTSCTYPGWAPGSRRLLLGSNRFDARTLVDVDNNPPVVVATPGEGLHQGSWAPDGTRILVTRVVREEKMAHSEAVMFTLEHTPLEPIALVTTEGFVAERCAWAPDSRWLACVASRSRAGSPFRDHAFIAFDTSDHAPRSVMLSSTAPRDFAWVGSDWIAYLEYRKNGLFALKPTSPESKIELGSAKFWSPLARGIRAPFLAVVGGCGGACMYRFDRETLEPHPLGSGDVHDLDWSPDGRHLAFRESHPPGKRESLWILRNVDSREASLERVMEAPPGFQIHGRFSPKGGWFSYAVGRRAPAVLVSGNSLASPALANPVEPAGTRWPAPMPSPIHPRLTFVPDTLLAHHIETKTDYAVFSDGLDVPYMNESWAPDERALVAPFRHRDGSFEIRLCYAVGAHLSQPESLPLAGGYETEWQP